MTCQRSNPCAFYENPVDTACNCAGNCTPATPSPFYASSVGCQEEQVKTVIQNQYATGLTTSVSFNIPACGESVQVTFPGLQLVNIGSYLWNPTYGYLKITSFDIASATVTVQNECQDGNAAAGTEVPSCTVFTVTDNPIGIDNPCTNAVVEQGALVVCKNGVMQPLDATSPGQVPVSQDAGTNEVKFETIDLQVLNCTPLTAILTLLPGNTGPYIFNVDDSSIFVSGDVVLISGTNHRFLVATVPNGLQFTANLITPATTSIESHSVGENICMAGCCDQIQQQIDEVSVWQGDPCNWDLTDRLALVTANNITVLTPHHILDTLGTETDSDYANLVLTNPSCTNQLIHIDAWFKGLSEMVGAAGEYGIVNFFPRYGSLTGAIGTVPVPAATTIQDVTFQHNIVGVSSNPHAFHYHWSENILLASGQELKVSARSGIGWIAGDADGPNVSRLQTGLLAYIIQF